MKNPIRLQSHLLIRRSYKPIRANRRALGIIFRPGSRLAIKVTAVQEPAALPSADDEGIAHSA